jgi:phosphoribosyl 1,2-cyclic phosphodiesterase
VAFVVEYDGKRLGVFTDLGHPFERLREAVGECDAAYLESNYDPEMLEVGSYPPLLKARIRGDGGHISNGEAAGLLRERGVQRPKWIALAHLSQENNHPDVALRTHRSILGDDFPLHVAGRDGPTELLHV